MKIMNRIFLKGDYFVWISDQLESFLPSYCSEACNLLVTQLLPVEEAEYDEWLEKLLEHIQRQTLVSPVLEKQHIELAIRVMLVLYSS